MAGLKYLTYKTKKLPLKLGIFTMMLVQEEYGVSFNQGEDGEGNLTPTQYVPLLYYGLQQGHKLAKRPFTLEMEDMHDVLNDCFMEFIETLPSFFPDNEDMVELGKSMGAAGKEKETEKKEEVKTPKKKTAK